MEGTRDYLGTAAYFTRFKELHIGDLWYRDKVPRSHSLRIKSLLSHKESPMDIDLGFSGPQFPGSLAKLQSDQSEPQIHLVDI